MVRSRRTLLIALAAIMVFVVGAWLALTGPGGRYIAMQFLDGYEIEGLGRLEIEELTGDVTDQFSIGAARIVDAENTLIEADDIFVDWSLVAVLRNRLQVDDLTISRLSFKDMPKLVSESEREADSGFSAIRFGAISISELDLSAVVEQQPAFSLRGSASMEEKASLIELFAERDGVEQLDLSVQLQDDVMDGELLGDWVIAGERLSISAIIDGSVAEGRTDISIQTDELSLVSAQGVWDPQILQVKAEVSPVVSEIFGGPVLLSDSQSFLVVNAVRPSEASLGRIDASAEYGELRFALSGELDATTETVFRGEYSTSNIDFAETVLVGATGSVAVKTNGSIDATVAIATDQISVLDRDYETLLEEFRSALFNIHYDEASITLRNGRIETGFGAIELSGHYSPQGLSRLEASAETLDIGSDPSSTFSLDNATFWVEQDEAGKQSAQLKIGSIANELLTAFCADEEPGLVLDVQALNSEIRMDAQSVDAQCLLDLNAVSVTSGVRYEGQVLSAPSTQIAAITLPASAALSFAGTYRPGELKQEARMSVPRVLFNGQSLDNANAEFVASGDLSSLSSRLRGDFLIEDEPAAFSARFEQFEDLLDFPEISAGFETWSIKGDASIRAGGMEAQLILAGPSDTQGTASISLSNEEITTRITLPKLAIEEASLHDVRFVGSGAPENFRFEYQLGAIDDIELALTGEGRSQTQGDRIILRSDWSVTADTLPATGTWYINASQQDVSARLIAGSVAGLELSADFEMDAQGDRRIDFDFDIKDLSTIARNFDIDSLIGQFEGTGSIVFGSSEAPQGEISVQARQIGWQNADAQLDADLHVQLTNQASADLSFSAPGVFGRASALVESDGERRLTVRETSGRAQATIAGLLALAPIETVNASGDADLTWFFTQSSNGLNGDSQLTIENTAFAIPGFGLSFKDGNGAATIDRVTGLIFDASILQTGGGQLSVSGQVDPDFDPEITANYDSFTFINANDMLVRGSGHLTVSRENSSLKIGGRTDVTKANFGLQGGTNPGFAEIDYTDPDIDTEALGSGELSLPITIDHRIVSDRTILVNAPQFETTWSADLRLLGPLADFGVFGDVQLDNGAVRLVGPALPITQGRIEFGGDPLAGNIDLLASRRQGETTVELIVAGTVQSPRIDYTSRPELPRDEVLAILAFGKPIDDLTAFELARLTQFVSGVGGALSWNPLSPIEGMFGLERVSLQTNRAGRAVIALSQSIGDRISIDVEAGERSTTSRIEWSLNRNLSLLSVLTGDASSLVALLWGVDFDDWERVERND